MFRNHRDEKEKELIRFFDTWDKLWARSRNSGTWIDIEPYQRGWVRKFKLRDDAKNRVDAQYMRQVLDLVNNKLYSRNQDFQKKNWKTGKLENIPQKLGRISSAKYDTLNEKLKSYFSRIDVFYKLYNKYVTEYEVCDDYYYVYEINPNIITQHWVPDAEIESLLGEMNQKIRRDNLWPKVAKARGQSSGYHHYKLTPYMKNKMGDIIESDDFDIEVA